MPTYLLGAPDTTRRPGGFAPPVAAGTTPPGTSLGSPRRPELPVQPRGGAGAQPSVDVTERAEGSPALMFLSGQTGQWRGAGCGDAASGVVMLWIAPGLCIGYALFCPRGFPQRMGGGCPDPSGVAA